MNKASFLALFSLLQCLDCFSQSASGKLTNPIIHKSDNGFIVYGFTGEKKATEFNVIKYNKELTETARYKKLNPNNKWQGAFMMVEGNQLRFVMSGGEGGVILLSASTLEEISFVAGFDKKYSDEYNKKFSSDSSKYFFDLTYCIYNYQYVTEFDTWGTAIMPFLITQAPSKSPSFKTGKIVTYKKYNTSYTLPAAVFTDRNNWLDWPFGNFQSIFFYKTGRNKGTKLFATGSRGQSIFWTIYKGY